VESLHSWVVKVEMREPLVIHEVPSTGSADYTEEDVAHMHRRLRDELAFNAPRRLVNATIQDGVFWSLSLRRRTSPQTRSAASSGV